MTTKAQRIAALSPAARKLYARVLAGHWYPWDGPNGKTPKAMAELVKARLVRVGGRVERVRAAYVPTGTKPYKLERYPE